MRLAAARTVALLCLVLAFVPGLCTAQSTCDACVSRVFANLTQTDPNTGLNVTLQVRGQWCLDSSTCISQQQSGTCGDSLPYATLAWQCECQKRTANCETCVENPDPTQACVWCDDGCYFQQYAEKGDWDSLCSAKEDVCERDPGDGITDWVLAVVISCAISVCLCILCAIGVVIYRKRKGSDGGNYY